MLLPKRRKHGSNGRRSYRESCEQFFNFIKNSFRDGNTSFKLSDIHDQLSCEKHHIDLIIKVLISLSLIDNSKGEEQMFWFETSSLVKKLSLFKPTTSTSVDTFLGEVNFNSVECILHQLVSLLLEDVDTPIRFTKTLLPLFILSNSPFNFLFNFLYNIVLVVFILHYLDVMVVVMNKLRS